MRIQNGYEYLFRKKRVTLEVLDSVRHEVVENVEASFILGLIRDARFLQKVDLHISPGEFAALVEVDANELALNRIIHWNEIIHVTFFWQSFTYKSRTVIISNSLGISKGLQNGVCLDDLTK